MLPNRTDNRWQNLVEGKISAQFDFIAASMCLSRIQRGYRMNPTSAVLNDGIEELYNFFVKYEKNMQKEISQIFG